MMKRAVETMEVMLVMLIIKGESFLVRHGLARMADPSKIVQNLTSLAEYFTFGL